MKIKISNIFKFTLLIIIIGCENCFYLIDTDSVNISGVFNYTDIFILIALVFSISVYLKYGWDGLQNYRYKYLIFSTIILSIVAALQAFRLYGQDFIVGLRPQRFWIVWGMLYFPIRRLMKVGIIKTEELVQLISTVCLWEIVLYILQYVLGDSITFLHVMNNQRYGGARYYFYNILLRVFLFINLDAVFNHKKLFKSSICIISVLFILLVVGKMRMTSIATLIAMVFGIFIWRKGVNTKLFVIVLCGIASVVLFNAEIVQDTIHEVSAYLDGTLSSVSTLNIRDSGRQLYMQAIMSHPIAGGGYPSVLNAAASEAAGFTQNIYLVDNGLWGFIYIYGGLGIIWLIAFFRVFIIKGWQLVKKNNIYFILLVPLGWLIAGQTEAHWYYENGFVCVALLLALLEGYEWNNLNHEGESTYNWGE